jgi:hypothetical protein
MDGKLPSLTFLAVALIAGYFAGGLLVKYPVSKVVWLLLYLVGAFALIAGSLLAEHDHRYRWLAISGLFFKVTAVRTSFGRRRTVRTRSVDLWATPKQH